MRSALLGTVWIALCTTSAMAAAAVPAEDGLVAVASPSFDRLYRQAGVDLAGYRHVVLDPPRVEFAAGWLKRMNQTRDITRRIGAGDVEAIAEQIAFGMTQALSDALRAQGYEVVAAPGPGVLRLSPAATDVFVDAPYVPAPGIQIGIVHDSAGEATMRLDVLEPRDGAVAMRIADRGQARTLDRFAAVNGVSNLFWFEAMFSAWARGCVTELQRVPAIP